MKTGNMHIVSGFIGNINRRSDRDITKYLKYGLELMAVEIPMTIFIEREVFDEHVRGESGTIFCDSGVLCVDFCSSLFENPDSFVYRVCGGVMDGIQQKYSYVRIGHITFVFFRMCDLFLWYYREMAHHFELNTGNPNKDTLEYMMVQCQKSEWMAIASQLNRELRGLTTNEYVWIDFGIFHMFQGKIDTFQIELYKMRARINRRIMNMTRNLGKGFCIRNGCAAPSSENRFLEKSDGILDQIQPRGMMFARCWDPAHIYNGNIYKDVNWLFAGSVFGGCANSVNIFALLVREKCLQVLREKNTLMWEINIWVIIYREFPELFAFYPSDHSEIIFRGYS